MTGAVKDGGILSIEPWMIPHRGGGTTTGGKSWATSPGGVSYQGSWASTGVSGGFGATEAPGDLPSAQHRGYFGGRGIRTGGSS